MGKHWTKQEVELLKEHYPKKGAGYIAENLGRNELSVISKAQRLRLVSWHRKSWSKEDDANVKEFYLTHEIGYLVQLMPWRTKNAIRQRALYLGIKGRFQLPHPRGVR